LHWCTFCTGSLSVNCDDEKLIELASEGRMFCACLNVYMCLHLVASFPGQPG